MSVPIPGSRVEILRLAWPILVSMLSFSLKGFVDTMMVGRLGTDALGAVGIASIATWAAITFPWGVLRGQRPLVSQYLGAGQPQLAFSFGVHAIYLALAWGVMLFALAGPLSGLVNQFVGSTRIGAEGVGIAEDYFALRLRWAMPLLCFFAIAEYLRSTGRMRMPMVVDLVSHPLNMLFNYALIYGNFGMPELGARGAAIGTGLADSCALALLLCILLLERRRALPVGRARLGEVLRFRWERLREVTKVGLSGGLQFAFETYAFLAITWLVGRTEQKVALAVHQAGIQLIHLSLMPAIAVADAASVIIGRAVGALRWEEVSRTLRSALEIVIPFMGAMSLLFLLAGRELCSLILRDQDPATREIALQLGAGVMAAAALWQLGDALQVVFRFALRATGDHRWVMATGILCSWVLSLPLVAWVVFTLKGDITQIWLVWTAEIFIGDAIFVWRWRSGVWRSRRLVKDSA
jgi:MATE family multidrug resistance protein